METAMRERGQADELMDKEYSDSSIPMSIGTSFVLALVVMLSAGAAAGFLLKGQDDVPQLGGFVLLLIFMVLIVGPVLYNKKPSRFEKQRSPLFRMDGIGILQGLRGALFRLILYDEGFEIRAFYHRYFIPFAGIKKFSIEKGYVSTRINFETGLAGVPDYLTASDSKFDELARLIEKKRNQARC